MWDKEIRYIRVDYPYLGTPYENFAEDYKKIELFIKKIIKLRVLHFGAICLH